MNPNPEKAVSQEPQASGAGYNSLAAAFGELGVTPASFPKEAVNDPKDERMESAETTTKAPAQGKHERNHKGPGKRGNSAEIQAATARALESKVADRQLEAELKKDEKIFDKEAKRMQDAYAQFSEDLNALEKRLSEETNYRRKKRLNALKSQAMDHLWVLRKFLPKKESGVQSDDIEAFKSVAEKFKKYEDARRRQTIAEIDLNKTGGSIGKHEEARNEAIKLREEISSLIQQGESVVAKNSPHPAQDESIGNIRTEGAEVMSTVQPDTNPDDLLVLPPEGSAPGSLELPNEEQIGGIEQGTIEPEDLRINTPMEALTEQAAVSAEPQREEPGQPTIKDWQEEAIQNYEQSGRKVLDADLEHTQEEHDANLPVLTEVVDESDSIPVLTEIVGEAVSAPREGEVSTLELKKEETLEERKERILNIIYKKAEDVPNRGKRAGMSETMLDIMHAGGETYRALPLKTKLLVSATLFGIAWTAGGTIASVAIGGSLFQRALGGLATFVGVEGLLKASAEKDGRERGEWEKRRHTAEALIAGFIVGGGGLGQAIQNVFHEIVPSPAKVGVVTIEPSELEQGQANLAATEHFNATNVPVEGGAAAEVENLKQFIKIAEPGDSRWSLAERALAEGPYRDQFNAIASDEQRTYIIDAIKDKLAAGMTAEQADALNVGDKIDFQNLFTEWDPTDKVYFIDKIFSEAQNLKPEELAHIQSYQVEMPTEIPARAVSADELLGQPLLTDFTPPEQPSVAIPSPEAGKLTDNFISSNVNVSSPVEVIAPPPAVSAETVGLVSLATAATTMPQEFTPKNPQVLAYIDQQFHNDIDTLFGKKGILGIGKVQGIKSAHWLDFENRTFAEIKNANPTEGANGTGMNNSVALKKMQSYLLNVAKESKIQPEGGETAGKYIRRAMELTASRLQETQ